MTGTGMNDLIASIDSPLIVVTTSAEGESVGCLVGFHTQSSMSPAQYCFFLSKANHTYRVSLRTTRFAVHFLTADDLDSSLLPKPLCQRPHAAKTHTGQMRLTDVSRCRV